MVCLNAAEEGLSWLPWLLVVRPVTVCSSVTAVEAVFVDEVDGGGSGSVEELLFVVAVSVLLLHALLQHLVVLPQRHVLDPFNLRDKTAG